MTFGEKLKIARTEAGLKQAELAKQLNTSGNTISNWENNVSKPDLDTLSYICGILHVNASFFLQPSIPDDEVSITELKMIKQYRLLDDFGKGTVQLAIDRELKRSELIADQSKRIAKLESTPIVVEKEKDSILRIYTYLHKIACAGNGFYFDDIPTDSIEAPYLEGADFIIGVNGDSMEPTFKDGDLVYVQKRQIVETGDIGVFFYNNECFIKEAGEDGLISHNSKYKLIPGTERIQCIGKVLGKVI